MHAHLEPGTILAYETQARYVVDEDWVTLAVSSCPLLTLHEMFVRHDPWERAPIELRVHGIALRHR